MWPTWKEFKELSKSYKTINGGPFGKYDDLKIKLANLIIKNSIEVLPIAPDSNGKICDLYLNRQRGSVYSINNDIDLEIFLCDMNRNVGFEIDGWRYEFIVIDNMDNYSKVVVERYKITEGELCHLKK